MEPDAHREEAEMDAEIVCSNMLSEADLAALLEQCTFLQQGIFLGESLPLFIVSAEKRDTLIRFIPFYTTLPYEIYAKYTFGRIFHLDFELRWQHESGKVWVMYIGIERKIPFLRVIDYLKLEKRLEQQDYYLFGERLRDNHLEIIGKPAGEDDFAEARIPRLLHYPVKGRGRYVQLVVQEYLDEKTKQVALHRIVAVKEA
jgi:hypothetical protein